MDLFFELSISAWNQVRWINTVIGIKGRMTVGALPVPSSGGVEGDEPGSIRGVVELAVAAAGSGRGGGPIVFASQKAWRPAGRKGQRESILQPFSQNPDTPTSAKEFQIGFCGVVEADLELFCNGWSAGILREWLYGENREKGNRTRRARERLQ